jgi:mannose-6-phosphate isomerase-like protein (cupin superfamily)
MAHAGQILDNPISGERIIFRETAADTGGELLAIDLILSPGGHVPGAHVHPAQEERFEVVSGTMKFRLGRKKILAEAGDTVTVPAGSIHKFANAGDVPAHVRVEVRPALKMEQLFEMAKATRPCRAIHGLRSSAGGGGVRPGPVHRTPTSSQRCSDRIRAARAARIRYLARRAV